MTKRAESIVTTIAALPPDSSLWDDGDRSVWMAAREAAGRLAGQVANREQRATEARARQDAARPPRPKQKRRKPDPPELVAAKKIVHERSGGVCEHCHDQPGTNVHHLAGRGWSGCHHPDLLIDLCGWGNATGCHKLAHTLGKDDAIAAGLRVDRGVAQRTYRDSWPPS